MTNYKLWEFSDKNVSTETKFNADLFTSQTSYFFQLNGFQILYTSISSEITVICCIYFEAIQLKKI